MKSDSGVALPQYSIITLRAVHLHSLPLEGNIAFISPLSGDVFNPLIALIKAHLRSHYVRKDSYSPLSLLKTLVLMLNSPETFVFSLS